MENTALKERISSKNTAAATEHKEETSPIHDAQMSVLNPESSEYVALTSDALGIINENLKNQQLSFSMFDIIKAPAGGVTSFTVPGIGGDEMEKELSGIVIAYTTPRAYWSGPDPVEGTPPECWSKDSVISHDGQPCVKCAFNEFGSKDNGDGLGKACKESVTIFLLQAEKILPVVVRVPVSSKNLFFKYVTRLISFMMPISGVVTKITLEKATNKTGQPYATYNFEVAGKLSPDEAVTAKAYGQKFLEIMDTANVDEELADVA